MLARNFGKFLPGDTTTHIPEGGRQASWLAATDVGRRDVSRVELSHGCLSCN